MRNLKPCYHRLIVLFFVMLLASFSRAITPADEPVVQAVAKTLPAVVNINTEGVIEVPVQDPFSLFFDRYYSMKQKVKSLGSGVLVSNEGYILTCAHVVERATKLKIKVTLSNGKAYEAKFCSADVDRDMALIKIDDKTPFPFLDLNHLSPNLLGQTVIALGNPVGYENSVSQGILSAKNRTVSANGNTMEGLIQTDAAINPGNSGGASVDINGNFVGLNSAKFAGTAIEGIGFAIPGEVVAPWTFDAIAIAKGLKKAPPVVSPLDTIKKRFGITLQPLTPELAETFNLPNTSGMIITEIQGDSSAEEANLKTGLLVTRIGNIPLRDEESLPRELTKIKPGQRIDLQIAFFQSRGRVIVRNTTTVVLTAK